VPSDSVRPGPASDLRMDDGSAVLPGLGGWQERRLPVAAAPV
jgi:hypothetical protein